MVRAALVLLLAGCTSREPPAEATKEPTAMTISKANIGRRVELRGEAINHKGGAVLKVGDQNVWIDGLASWPMEFYAGGDHGKMLVVTGILDEDHGLPVFVPREGEPLQQGIPVPEGTDVHAASHRFILREANW
jgi:hypothetical protein